MRTLDFRVLILSSPALVEISELHFAYGKRAVLKGINMTFPKGKLIAIMGLSGCGKTTLLRHIGGVLKPTKGYVKVGGQIIHELDHDALYAMRRKMGMLFQFGALFTDMSVYVQCCVSDAGTHRSSRGSDTRSGVDEVACGGFARYTAFDAFRTVRRYGAARGIGACRGTRPDADHV